jgi:hypothetical protein
MANGLLRFPGLRQPRSGLPPTERVWSTLQNDLEALVAFRSGLVLTLPGAAVQVFAVLLVLQNHCDPHRSYLDPFSHCKRTFLSCE